MNALQVQRICPLSRRQTRLVATNKTNIFSAMIAIVAISGSIWLVYHSWPTHESSVSSGDEPDSADAPTMIQFSAAKAAVAEVCVDPALRRSLHLTRTLPARFAYDQRRHVAVVEGELIKFPEIKTVFTKTGRPEIANDVMGVHQSDIWVMLTPRDTWPRPKTREELISEMESVLTEKVPGVAFGFTQPIEMRVDELVAGVKADVAVMVYGNDLETLALKAKEIERTLRDIPGAADVKADIQSTLETLTIVPRRDALARYGVDAAQVMDVVAALGGRPVGEVLEGRARFPIRVRFPESWREKISNIGQLPVALVGGKSLPLHELADVEGDFENLQSASRRLLLITPIVLLVIFLLLHTSFGSVRLATLIFLCVPIAASGGVFALLVRGMPFSIAAGVGFIALFGVAVLNALVWVSDAENHRESGSGAKAAALNAADDRLRPVLMTALVASLGFLPMAISTSDGAEIQRPLATVVIGGLITATLLTTLVIPAIYPWFAEGSKEADSDYPARRAANSDN